jgi:hypothetical protein
MLLILKDYNHNNKHVASVTGSMNFGRKLPATLGPLAFKRAGVQPMQQRTWMHVAASGRAYKSKFVKSDLLFNAKNPHWVSSCLSFFLSASTGATYIFTPFTCTTTIISLEPCALNAEFQHFALSCSIVYWRFNKMSLLCRYQHFILRFNKMSLLRRYQHFILRFNKMSLLRRYQHFILRFNKMSLLRRYKHFILRFNKMSLLCRYQHFILRFNKMSLLCRYQHFILRFNKMSLLCRYN